MNFVHSPSPERISASSELDQDVGFQLCSCTFTACATLATLVSLLARGMPSQLPPRE